MWVGLALLQQNFQKQFSQSDSKRENQGDLKYEKGWMGHHWSEDGRAIYREGIWMASQSKEWPLAETQQVNGNLRPVAEKKWILPTI